MQASPPTESDQIRRLERRLVRERAAREEAERISERGLRALYTQKRQLEVMHALAVASADAERLAPLLERVLEACCAFAGWPLARAWYGSGQPVTPWHGSDPFASVCTAADAWIGAGGALAACLAGGQPQRLRTHDADLDAARRAGLPSLVLVPVGPADLVLAFFGSAEPAAEDVELATHAATLLGQAASRFAARAAVSRGEARYRGIFDYASDALFVVEGGSGRFVEANPAYARLTGLSVDELRRRTVFDLWTGTEAELRALAQSARERGYLRLGEHEQRAAGGATGVLEISVSHVVSEGEELFVCVGRDVSERRRYERGLIEARDRAESLARLRDAFLRNMSHEFRTPLAGILGCAEVLRAEAPPALREFADMIDGSGRRLLATLQSVLDLSELEADVARISPTVVDLRNAARQVYYRSIGAARRKKLTFELDVPTHAIAARTDAHLLGRALDQIVGNALRFTDAGEVRILVRLQEGGACVLVSDTGIGIGEAYLPSLFEPFTQENDGDDRTHEGCGVGMALVERIAQALGARVEVDSVVGEGTIVALWLPAS
jgi:PAS domain S-box-containing protein